LKTICVPSLEKHGEVSMAGVLVSRRNARPRTSIS
jgi:hypothetical protein